MKSRVKQGSTWAGIAALFQVGKVFFPQYAMVIDGLTALAGSAAVAINDTKTVVDSVKQTKSTK